MTKIEGKIREILQKNIIFADSIEEIIVKNDKNAIIGINIDAISLAKPEIEEIVKKAKEEMENRLKLEKITIILIESKKKKPNLKKSDNLQKSAADVKKNPSFLQYFRQIFTNFAKKSPNREENSQIEQKTVKIQEKPILAKTSENSAQNPPKMAPETQKHETPQPQNGSAIQPVKGVKKIIAVASAKGGVGKSTFAVNLAASLKKVGHKVALVDADIYGPSITHLMNLQGKPDTKDGLLLPLISHNIKCISVGSIIEEGSAGVWRGPMITKILHQLIRSVDWAFDGQEVDYMIIDMPPGTGDVYLSLAQNFPLCGVVVVSTPQSLAVIDVMRSIDCFSKLKIPILGLVQNMSYLLQNGEKTYIFGRDKAKEMAQEMQINFLGDIPIKQEISDASESKIPFVISNPNSQEALLYGRISEKIIDAIA